jgi:hypothetical protein
MASSDLPEETRESLQRLDELQRALERVLATQSEQVLRLTRLLQEAANRAVEGAFLRSHHGVNEDKPEPPPVPQQASDPGQPPRHHRVSVSDFGDFEPYEPYLLIPSLASGGTGDEPMNKRLELTPRDWEKARKAVRHTAPTLLLGTSKRALDEAAKDLQDGVPAREKRSAISVAMALLRLLRQR